MENHSFRCGGLTGKKAWLLLFFLFLIFTLGCQRAQVDPVVIVKGPLLEDEIHLSLSQLMAMEEGMVEADYFSINSYGTEEYTSFKGVWVWHLFQELDIVLEEEARIRFTAEDGYETEYSLAEIKRDDYMNQKHPEKKYRMILAFKEEGELYDPEDGNPFRLVRGQKEVGETNKPYWISQVKTITIDP